jgi:peptidoglycan hydrolase CwlO-like protein
MNWRHPRQFIIVILLLLIATSFNPYSLSVYGQTPTETPTPSPTSGAAEKKSERLGELRNQITELESKISSLQAQGKTLASQISVMDNQMKLTQLRINSVEQQITELNEDIELSSKKITNLEGSLNGITKVLINRIVATYQVGSIEPLQVLLTSNDVRDFVKRANYLRLAQAHDKRLIYDTQQAKNDYQNQKSIFEGKKKKVETLQAELVQYTEQLEQEKKNKQALLQVTQNDENVYQQKLAAARAEQSAIQQISSGGGNAVPEGDVNEGDVIGRVIQGRSPCSTGTHLHFEVKQNGSYVDPASILSNRGITWDNAPDGSFGFSGSASWPISEPTQIFQGYGMTYYARVLGYYGGGPHTGIDMNSTASSSVRSIKKGKLYRGGIACGGGTLQFARVDHEGGLQSFYLHISP